MQMPRARTQMLLTQPVGSELVVYDQSRHHAHRLNEVAAFVWSHCDGRTPVAEVVAELSEAMTLRANEDVVLTALAQLEKANLLDNGGGMRDTTFRNVALAAGAIAVLAPIVESLLVPEPAAAYSW
ncbi:MAG TPA: PqqD family protein [Chloroflexota bacterium]|nr:PqqD family protein [Chloroflexota bacterium]